MERLKRMMISCPRVMSLVRTMEPNANVSAPKITLHYHQCLKGNALRTYNQLFSKILENVIFPNCQTVGTNLTLLDVLLDT